jgi:hypothetical protein
MTSLREQGWGHVEGCHCPGCALMPLAEAELNFVSRILKKAWNALRRVGA